MRNHVMTVTESGDFEIPPGLTKDLDPQIADNTLSLAELGVDDNKDLNAAHAEHSEATEAATESKAYRQRFDQNRRDGDDAEYAAAAEREDRDATRVKRAESKLREIITRKNANAENLRAVRRFLSGQPDRAALKPYPPIKPEKTGATWDETIGTFRVERFWPGKAALTTALDTPPLMESRLAKVPALVADLRLQGTPYIRNPAVDETLQVIWPTVEIGAARDPYRPSDFQPTVIDARAVAAWLAPDRLQEALERSIREEYEDLKAQGITPLSGPDKSALVKARRAELLQIERYEAALVWAGLEAGEKVYFRGITDHDALRPMPTDPRAVLQIA